MTAHVCTCGCSRLCEVCVADTAAPHIQAMARAIGRPRSGIYGSTERGRGHTAEVCVSDECRGRPDQRTRVVVLHHRGRRSEIEVCVARDGARSAGEQLTQSRAVPNPQIRIQRYTTVAIVVPAASIGRGRAAIACDWPVCVCMWVNSTRVQRCVFYDSRVVCLPPVYLMRVRVSLCARDHAYVCLCCLPCVRAWAWAWAWAWACTHTRAWVACACACGRVCACGLVGGCGRVRVDVDVCARAYAGGSTSVLLGLCFCVHA